MPSHIALWSVRTKALLIVMAAGALAPCVLAATGQSAEDSENEAIQYAKTPSNDPVAQLQKRIDRGEVKLPYYGRHGYLRSVLAALKVPVSSQMLVFSKTSFQHERISPEAPRALYFNDRVFIGWVQNGPVLEVATTDPQLGAVFYVLEQEKTDRPRFVRQTYECLECHESAMTGQVPGYTMRSVYARADGTPEFRAGSMLTTDQSPFTERWGGWYVTGKHGAMRHMGNVFARGGDTVTIDSEKGANITDLKPLVDTAPYLTGNSDIVALMVAEHQTSVSNLITRAGYETRMALDYDLQMNKALQRPADYRSESSQHRIDSVCEKLLRGLLFVGEAPLTDKVTGTSGFAEEFTRQGPFDRQHRSLRQFDLTTRLMRYPCSYLIYSDAFQNLPGIAKETVYRRLQQVLTGEDQGKDFAALSTADRKAIHEVLLDTCPDFASWTARQSKAGSTSSPRRETRRGDLGRGRISLSSCSAGEGASLYPF